MLRVNDNNKSVQVVTGYCDETSFALGGLVLTGECQRIEHHPFRVGERNSMLPQVRSGLP